MLAVLAGYADRSGVRLSAAQHEQFERYLALLREWSQHTNLVANADPGVVQRRHFGESIALGAALREREVLRPDASAVDVGAGAGFPGLPLKIAWPEIRLTLIEATAKKSRFLSAVRDALGLEGVDVVTGRAEDVARDAALRARFDVVLARALAPLRVMLELTLPFARVGGRVVTTKGSRLDEEMAAAKRALEVLGGRAFVLPFDVPGPPQRIVVVVKQRETPAAYPRRAGVPAKSPL